MTFIGVVRMREVADVSCLVLATMVEHMVLKALRNKSSLCFPCPTPQTHKTESQAQVFSEENICHLVIPNSS